MGPWDAPAQSPYYLAHLATRGTQAQFDSPTAATGTGSKPAPTNLS